MKFNAGTNPTLVDRLATADEIRAAVAPLSERSRDYASETVWEIASDLGGYVRIPTMEVETFRLLEELLGEQDARTN